MRRIARTIAPPVLLVGALLALGLAPGAVRDSGRAEAAVANTTTRTYYIAADEVNWNYAPLGRN